MQRSYTNKYVTASGKLKAKFSPAIFCDTSFLLDYWNSIVLKDQRENILLNPVTSREQLLINYIKDDKKLHQIFQIRKIVESFKCKYNLVYTPACRLELEDVISNARFKNNGAALIDTNLIAKKSRKEIGNILKKIRNDFENNPADFDLADLYWDHFFTTKQIDKGLNNFLEVDVKNFTLDAKIFHEIGILANFQIGFADIFHLISAKNLECKYFFTFDSDFLRGKKIISEYLQLEVITDIEEMKRILLKDNF